MNDLDGASSSIGITPTGNTIDDRFVVGGGGGYKAAWFRADVTVDYGPRASFTAVTPDYRMKIETLTALANVYFDLGTWAVSRLTSAPAPACRGIARRIISATRCCFPGIAGLKESRWDFAWAAMGGLTFNLSPNLLMDVSYRYLNMGDAITPIASNNNQITIKDMTAQEFRVGLRYNLN